MIVTQSQMIIHDHLGVCLESVGLGEEGDGVADGDVDVLLSGAGEELEEAPLQTLADCRPFVQLTSMALLSCPEIHPVETHPEEEGGGRIIPRISEAAHELWEAHKLPFEAVYPWAQPTQLVHRDALLQVEEAFRMLKERMIPTNSRESEDLLSTH